MLNLVAVRVGDRYGQEYVSILFDQLLRNLSCYEGDVRCWCITDDPQSLPEGITPIPHDPDLPGYWQKINLFAPHMPWAKGERVAYFDLDLCITGRLEDLVERKGTIKDWLWEGCYNSSVMVWDHGEHKRIWEFFTKDRIDAIGSIVPLHALPKGQPNGGDQEWITEVSKSPDRAWETFPASWCVNYRLHAQDWPPEGSKVVSFNGKPKPHEITEGWVPNVWKIGGMTSLPEMRGVNTTKEHILANVATNVQRDLPWFKPSYPNNHTMVLCCGGPSLAESLQEIRAHRRRGARIVSVNNTLKYLVDNGIMPHAHVMLDARPENADFLANAPKSVVYFLASQCDPVLFELMEDHDVTLWHNAVDGGELEKLAEPFETPERPLQPVPGGGTVGLRCIWLAFFSGYRKLHIYGMDGSYRGSQHHAFPQSLNDGEDTLDVVMADKHYKCARWQARQAMEAQSTFREVHKLGMSVFVHGTGIVPDIHKLLREQWNGTRGDA